MTDDYTTFSLKIIILYANIIKEKFPFARNKGTWGVERIALHSFDLDSTWGGWLALGPGGFTPGKEPLIPIEKADGWARRRVWTFWTFSGIKVRILNRLVRNLATVVTELSQLRAGLYYHNISVIYAESFA
jgi:hypothetical protein